MQHLLMRTRHATWFWVGLLLMTASRSARAEQFVLFDATFTYTWDDAINAKPSLSHYYVNEGNWLNKARPANWMSPVNYRDGTVHIHVEVIEKPAGTQQAGWALCLVGNAGSYGCPYTPYYTKTGVYESDVDMHSFYNNATIDWSRGIKQVDLVYTVNNSGSGHITNFPNLKDLVTPTRVRISMVQVSAGSTYDPGVLLDGGTEAGDGRDSGSSVDARGPIDAPSDDATIAGSGGIGGSGVGGAPGVGGSGGDTVSGSGGLGTGGAGVSGAAGAPAQGAGGGTMTTGTGHAGANAAQDQNLASCACSFGSRDAAPAGLGATLAAMLSSLWIRGLSRFRRRNARRERR